MAKLPVIPEKYRVWIEARKRYHLSDIQVQMARELGLNPLKFGKLANEKQEPWKKPLPEFIEELYSKRFKKDRPDAVIGIEKLVQNQKEKKAERKKRHANSAFQVDNDNVSKGDEPGTTPKSEPRAIDARPTLRQPNVQVNGQDISLLKGDDCAGN